jgi:hypothetical protein
MEYAITISPSDSLSTTEGISYETSGIQLHGSNAESFSPIDKYLSDDSWPVSASYLAAIVPIKAISTVSLGIELPPGGGEVEVLHERLLKKKSLADYVSSLETSIKTNDDKEVKEQVPGPVDAAGATYSAVIPDEDLPEPVNSMQAAYDAGRRDARAAQHNTTRPAAVPEYLAARAADAPTPLDELWIQHQRRNHRTTVLPGRVRKPRTVLPIIIDEHIFDSNPDSGSEENIMTFELVTRLGLSIENGEEHQREFRIANGKVVKALGRVQALCAFAKDRGVAVLASFYVFRTLVSEVIMGMDFLDSTETLTKHKYRLDKKVVSRHGIYQVSALNNPRRRLRCTATGKSMLANADTGAEMDLISLKYARLRGLKCHKLEAGETQVQLADGSTTNLGGKVFLDIKMKTDGPSSTSMGLTRRFYSEAVKRPFYILESLTCSLLLGEETLEELNVFEKYRESLVLENVEESCLDRPEVCTILWFDTIEKFFSSGTKAPPPLSGRSSVVSLFHITEGIDQY